MNYVKIDRYMTLYLMILIINSVTHDIQAAFYPDNYLGCFEDHKYFDVRILPFQQPNSDNNSRKRCEDACSKDGHTLAGTESAIECFCGHELNYDDKVSDSECDHVCPGNENEFCGGHWRISIYNISDLTHQSTSTIQTTELTSVSDIFDTKTTSTEAQETILPTTTVHTNELQGNTTKQLDNLNAKRLTMYIIIPAAIVVIIIVIIAIVLLKRRFKFRQKRKSVSKIVYDAAGSSQDIYENETGMQKDAKKVSQSQDEETQQYSLVAKEVVDEAADEEYNILNLKASSEQCHNFTLAQDRTQLDHTYSHISNSESCPNAFNDTYSHFEPNSSKALSTMEDSYDRL